MEKSRDTSHCREGNEASIDDNINTSQRSESSRKRRQESQGNKKRHKSFVSSLKDLEARNRCANRVQTWVARESYTDRQSKPSKLLNRTLKGMARSKNAPKLLNKSMDFSIGNRLKYKNMSSSNNGNININININSDELRKLKRGAESRGSAKTPITGVGKRRSKATNFDSGHKSHASSVELNTKHAETRLAPLSSREGDRRADTMLRRSQPNAH